MNNTLKKILSAAALCALLMLPCACGEDPIEPIVPAVSVGDVSGSDITSSESDWYSALSDEHRALADVVLDSVQALNLRDLDAYMSTVDPESKAYESTREDAVFTFAHYDLSVTVDSFVVESVKNDKAVVTVVQSTTPVTAAADVAVSDSDVVSGSDVSSSDIPAPLTGRDYTSRFVPCTTSLTHTLVLRDGTWYISSTVVNSYTELALQ